MRLNSDSEQEPLKPDDWIAQWERIASCGASAGQDTPCLRILRRWVPE